MRREGLLAHLVVYSQLSDGGMAPPPGRQQGAPAAARQFGPTATVSRPFAQAQAAAHTSQLHSSSSIYDNDDETEAVLASAFGQNSGDEGEQFGRQGGYGDTWEQPVRASRSSHLGEFADSMRVRTV